jgi:hypothetical protein
MAMGLEISLHKRALRDSSQPAIIGLAIRLLVHQARGAMSLGKWFACEWASCAARCVTDPTDRNDMRETIEDVTLVATPVRGPWQGLPNDTCGI